MYNLPSVRYLIGTALTFLSYFQFTIILVFRKFIVINILFVF